LTLVVRLAFDTVTVFTAYICGTASNTHICNIVTFSERR